MSEHDQDTPPPAALAARHAAAEEIARAAGAYVLDRFRNRGQVDVGRKGPHDEVSDADRAAEALIRERIAEAFPEDRVLGEEAGFGGDAAEGGNGWLWVVDPIDGTACFVAGIPTWCVSVAVMHDGRPVIGVVEDPNAKETFSGRAGADATCNGAPIRASDATDLGAGTVGIGYSMRVTPADTLGPLGRLLDAGGMFQRNGSGALMLTRANRSLSMNTGKVSQEPQRNSSGQSPSYLSSSLPTREVVSFSIDMLRLWRRSHWLQRLPYSRLISS